MLEERFDHTLQQETIYHERPEASMTTADPMGFATHCKVIIKPMADDS